MNELAPVLFISHGAPTFALEPGDLGPQLRQRSELLDNVKAVLAISPHWSTSGNYLMTDALPGTLHDFGGFPAELYQLDYPAPGAPELGESVIASLRSAGIEVHPDPTRPRDHGVWVPLFHLRPQADIPVFQLSLNGNYDPERLLNLGNALAALRPQGIAIMASGGITHNLFDMRLNVQQPADYVVRFQDWVRERVVARNFDPLLKPAQHSSDFERAHPSDEHYTPLLIALGASNEQDQLEVLEADVQYHAISMESYLWS